VTLLSIEGRTRKGGRSDIDNLEWQGEQGVYKAEGQETRKGEREKSHCDYALLDRQDGQLVCTQVWIVVVGGDGDLGER
jgi:hypothetical protein